MMVWLDKRRGLSIMNSETLIGIVVNQKHTADLKFQSEGSKSSLFTIRAGPLRYVRVFSVFGQQSKVQLFLPIGMIFVQRNRKFLLLLLSSP